MRITQTVKKILRAYESDNPGTKKNLAHMLGSGRLGGTGRMIILPVDQGFEHGPDRSFGMNSLAYDPHYHYQLAVDGRLSAFAAPLGMLEAGADTFAGQIPTILKVNSGNSLVSKDLSPNQAVTGTVQDALHLGCAAIGFTIYPGSDDTYDMYEEIRELTREAKDCGLAVIIWSYPRGNMTTPGETALDVVSYGAHMAALLGAHVIKVKLPTDHVELSVNRDVYKATYQTFGDLTSRVAHVVKCCFNGRRIVVFSGGATKGTDDVLADAAAIHQGGGHGSIIGRNVFQRPRAEALTLIQQITQVYLGKK